MANIQINGVSYSDVPSIEVPNAGAPGTASFFDTSSSTATAGDIVSGKVAYNANGSVVGSLTQVSVSQNSTTKVVTIS